MDLTQKEIKWLKEFVKQNNNVELISKGDNKFLKTGEKLFLELLNDLAKDCRDIRAKFIIQYLATKDFNEKQVLKIAESLEAQGKIFKPKFGYYRLTKSVIKND